MIIMLHIYSLCSRSMYAGQKPQLKSEQLQLFPSAEYKVV